MSGYLGLAKRAMAAVPSALENLDDRRRRRLEKAARIGHIDRWCDHHPRCIKAHDPTEGEWHHLDAEGCVGWVVAEANKHPKKGGAP